MKINLEVIHSCTIKRKKPWPKVCWIGKEKEQLFILDYQRISLIDPKTGKTRRKVAQLTPLIKSIVSYNLSDDGVYFAAILTNGDIIIWNKDKDTLRNISGRNEFALKLGFNCPSIFISNDAKKCLLITSRNKVYLWETDRQIVENTSEKKIGLCNSHINKIEGNWSAIVASKDIRTVEDSKELVLDARFKQNHIDGISALCCFVFNYENRLIVNILKIKWLSQSEIISQSQCRFETLWISYQPSELSMNNQYFLKNRNTSTKVPCLLTRGSYVLKLSHSADLIALASNQKYVERNSLVFMSPSNGTVCPVNLRNFGLNAEARGRHYWIQELNWMFNDLYIAGITKHGAIFLASRLGQPLLIHAIGREINMGPALYLTLHPLIIIRGKTASISQNQNNTDGSMSSVLENEDKLRQRYSIKSHPSLPVFACSDGYLVCIFQLQSAYSTQSRLMREIMHETIGLLNSVSKVNQSKENYYHLENPLNKVYKSFKPRSSDSINGLNEKNLPDWSLNQIKSENIQSEKSSDSGVDSNDVKEKTKWPNNKIAEGKIIFSYLPQVMPISNELMHSDSVVNKMENAFEYLQSAWSLLVSMSAEQALSNTHESDQTAKAIQQTFTHFAYLFLTMNSTNLKLFQVYIYQHGSESSNATSERDDEEFKLKMLIELFMRMIKFLYFDPASSCNPNSHMFVYIGRFVEKFCQSLLKFEDVSSSSVLTRTNLLALVYSLLNMCEILLKSIYSIRQDANFVLNIDSVLSQKINLTNMIVESETNDIKSDDHSLLVKSTTHEQVFFFDFLLEKTWSNLMHYSCKYRDKLKKVGVIRQSQLKSLDCLIILMERRMQTFPTNSNTRPFPNPSRQLNYLSIQKKSCKLKLSKADLVYMDLGQVDEAIDLWILQLNELFDNITNITSQKRVSRSKKYSQVSQLSFAIYSSIKVAHKIFYACLINYRLKKLIMFINSYFNSNDQQSSPFNLLDNTFKYLQPPKPLQKNQAAIISVIKSLARFMALYFINKPLLIYSVNNPLVMNSLLSKEQQQQEKDAVRIEMSKKHLTACINNQMEEFYDSENFSILEFEKIDLRSFFSTDKTLELLIVTGLNEEAIHFSYMINDWKSSFLLSSIFKETDQYRPNFELNDDTNDLNSENILSLKLCSILGFDKSDLTKKNTQKTQMKLLEKGELDSISLIIKELLICSVMTKANIVEPLLQILMESLTFFTCELSSRSVLVPEEFYLPAPPVFCVQMQSNEQEANELIQTETNLRIKLNKLVKCVITLLISSNLHAPLMKWYLEQLLNSCQEMKQNYGIHNQFKINFSLKTLLTSIRYQKLGYIPQNVLFMFRDLCAVLFFLDMRDKFSLVLRQYSRYFIQNQEIGYEKSLASKNAVQMSLKIIDYGNTILSFSSFFKQQHVQVKDIVLSTIARLTNFNQSNVLKDLNLEQKLATCVGSKGFFDSNQNSSYGEHVGDQYQSENFDEKLRKLVDSWKEIQTPNVNDPEMYISMAEVYEHNLSVNELGTSKKLTNIFGQDESCLHNIYLLKQIRQEPAISGGYNYERTQWCGEFLELFFKLGFEQTEDWEPLVQSVNQTPLLPEFYEAIRNKELSSNDYINKQFLIPSLNKFDQTNTGNEFTPSPTNTRSRRSIISNLNEQTNSYISINEANIGSYRQVGLFRSNSDLKASKYLDGKLDMSKKSVSFVNLDMNFLNELDEHGEYNILSEKTAANDHQHIEQSYKVLDYGPNYIQISYLAIWLIKWAAKFQKILMNHKSSASFWYNSCDSSFESLTTVKLNSINANFLVACVYLSNNNSLALSSLHFGKINNQLTTTTKNLGNQVTNQQKTEIMNDDDFTQISTSLSLNSKRVQQTDQVNKINEPSEISSLSTSIEMSSFTENRINSFPNKTNLITVDSNSKIPETSRSLLNQTKEFSHLKQEVSVASTSDALEFYKLNKSQNKSIGSLNTPNLNKENLNKSNESIKRKSSGSFEFLTNIFTKKDKSPTSRSKSPTKIPNQNSILKFFRSKSQESIESPTQTSQSKSKPEIASSSSHATDLHEIIRIELRKIVQIQHETVMNFLNNGQPTNNIVPRSFLPLTQELSAVLTQKPNSQNELPNEFIIETKVKNINSTTSTIINTQKIFEKKPQEPNYFMKKFNEPKTGSIKSSFIKIPLLDTQRNEETKLLLNHKTEVKTKKHKAANMALLDFKTMQNKNPSVDNDSMQKYVKMKQPSGVIRNFHGFPLLKLGQTETSNTKTMPKSELKDLEIIRKDSLSEESKSEKIEKLIKTPPIKATQQETKEIQCQKPMYDGYIISQGAFENMLHEENNNSNFADVHYKSTQHLRNNNVESNKNKKESYTMTDTLSKADLLAPDILFKLKFDTKRKDRQTDYDNELVNDYVNVVDLESNAVDEMMKLIEHEQSKRQGKYVEIKSLQKTKLISQSIEPDEPVLSTKDIIPVNDKTLDEQPKPAVDILTKNLFEKNQNADEWNEYDQLMHRQTELSSKEINGTSLGKQRIINEFKFIDEKIQLMNNMASNMNTDFEKYNKILGNIQKLNNERETIERYQKRESLEERNKVNLINQQNIADNPTIDNLNSTSINKPEPRLPREKTHESLNDLSDLKLEEEKRLEKILNDNSTINYTMELDNSFSTLLNHDQDLKVDSKLVDSQPKFTLTKQPSAKSSNKLKTTEKKSARESSPIIKNTKQMTAKREIQKETFSKQRERDVDNILKEILVDNSQIAEHQKNTNRQTSPTVKLTQKRLTRREIQKNNFAKLREEDAKGLLNAILADNSQLIEQQKIIEESKTNWTKSTEMSKKCKSRSPKQEPRQNEPEIPLLLLGNMESDLKTAQMTVKNKKLSLMAKTINGFKQKEILKQSDTELLLKDLELRAKLATKPKLPPKTSKTIKPFTNFVHLKQPSKLRNGPQHKPLTYGQVLSMHQEKTIVKADTHRAKVNEIYKIYGTRRVPGLYKGMVSNSLPKKQQNRLSDSVKKHRFTPYTNQSRVDEPNIHIDDLSDWSLDEKMKNILYEKKIKAPQKKLDKKKHVSYIENDQDTMADTDGDYMRELLGDEMRNDRMYQNALKDLSNMDKSFDVDNDYINQVNIEDLKNFSLTESASSFIDWDQIDQLVGAD